MATTAPDTSWFGMVTSSIFDALKWLFNVVIMKFIVFTIVGFLIEGVILLMDWVGFTVPDLSAIAAQFNSLSPGVWYFLNMFAIDVGMPAIFVTALVRMFLRRIPLIG
jgi:hypothetical protein